MPGSEVVDYSNRWVIASPLAGTTVTANYVLGTASGNTICGVLNPKGAPKNVFIKRAIVSVISGTLATGGSVFMWGVMTSANAATITSTGTEPLNAYTYQKATGVHQARYYAGDTTASVLAGSTVAAVSVLRPFGGGIAGATTAGTPFTLEETPDDLCVAPGTFLGLFPGVASSALLVVAALTVSEGA